MSQVRPWTLAVSVALATGATCATFAHVAWSSWLMVTGPTPADPADILLLLVSGSGLALALWLGVGTVVAALAQLPGAFGRACARLAAAVAPAALRKVTALLLGTSITAAAAPGTALATPLTVARSAVAVRVVDPAAAAELVQHELVVHESPRRPPPSAEPAPDPGFRPPAPPTARVPATLGPFAGSGRVVAPVEDHYVVRRGDTLWDIAARHLGPRASAAAIVREWPRWYAVNRAVIGPNPHHIESGQRLRPPDAAGTAAP